MAEWTKRFGLEGRAALVTGATKGIGLETCKVLADAGADIAAVMATVEGPAQAAKEALAAFGTVDILVNNAAIALIAPLLEATSADWDATMAVNLRAPFLLAKALVPAMIKKGGGKIINISSQAGVIGQDSHAAYGASKGGLNTLTKVMCVEWAKHNIQVNSVCPTVILTPMGEEHWGKPERGDPMKAKIPAGRFGKPVEVADMILYLASSASNLVNGQDMLIDGGYTAA